jgi:hypothetical protein
MFATLRVRRHPSKVRLHAWLDGEAAGDIDDHLLHCERCAATLEASAAGTPTFAGLLDQVLAAPEDLEARLRGGVAARLQTREDLRLLVELLGVPMETLKTFSAPQDPNGED